MRLFFRLIHLVHIGNFGLSGQVARPEYRPDDLWAGDGAAGKQIMNGHYGFAGCEVQFPGPVQWYTEKGSRAWLRALHEFGWIRDVEAFAPTRRSADLIRDSIADWIAHEGQLHALATQAEVAGERIANWLAHAKFILGGCTLAFRRRWLRSIASQALELEALLNAEDPRADMRAARGVLFAGLCLPYAGFLRASAMKAVSRLCESRMSPEGLDLSRNPSQQLARLRTLLEIHSALKKCTGEEQVTVVDAIRRMAGCLKYLMHGDGRLAVFNGGTADDARVIQMALSLSGDTPPTPQREGIDGFIRLVRANTLVIMDAGSPDIADPEHYSGVLGFELSDGAERVVVNCGAYMGDDPLWQKATRTAAAHTTLSIEAPRDWLRDSTNEDEGNTLVKPVVRLLNGEENGSQIAEAVCEGYLGYGPLIYGRQLHLHSSGTRLMGADMLSVKAGAHWSEAPVIYLRFHLHPDVRASRLEDGVIRLATLSGGLWRFSTNLGAAAQLEESIYLGSDGRPSKTLQIVAAARPTQQDCLVEWSFEKVH